jgi:HSP20 family molecular chaperone IbpA
MAMDTWRSKDTARTIGAKLVRSFDTMPGAIPVEVHHAREALSVIVRLPGVRVEDLRIALSRNVLTIDADSSEGRRHCDLPLSSPVDDRRAKMRFADGVLWMYLPKLHG